MHRPPLSSRFDYSYHVGRGVQIIKLFFTQFYPLYCYIVPHRTKYYTQDAILIHPQPTFLSQCERPCFKPIQHNRQSYRPVYLNFEYETGRHMLLHRMITSILWLPSPLNFFLNRILICLGCSHTLELVHPFKGAIISLYILTTSSNLI